MAWGKAHGFPLFRASEVSAARSLQTSDGSDGKAVRLCRFFLIVPVSSLFGPSLWWLPDGPVPQQRAAWVVFVLPQPTGAAVDIQDEENVAQKEYAQTKFKELCASISFTDCILTLCVVPQLALLWIESQERRHTGFVVGRLEDIQSKAEEIQKHMDNIMETEGLCRVEDAEQRRKVAWRRAKRLIRSMRLFKPA